jgi:hypothetical protein
MITRRLISIAVLLLMIFLPERTVSAQNSKLTPELLSKILAIVQTDGTDRKIPSPLAGALGLAAGEDWPTRQFNSMDTSGNYHAIGINRKSDQDIALVLVIPKISLHAFRVHHDGLLVAGAIHDLKTDQYTKLSRDAAQKELEAEFAYWQLVFKTAM